MSIQQFQNDTEEVLTVVAGLIENSDLTRESDREELYNQITELTEALNTEMEEVLPYELATEYFRGRDDASNLLGASTTSFNADGTIKGGIGQQLHIEQIESILMDSMMDLKAAYRTFESNAIGSIERALTQVQFDMATASVTGRNRDRLKQQVMQAFLREGQTAFITSDGKRLPLDFYASTVGETKMAQSNVQGHITRYEEADADLVQVQARPGTCEHCAAHDGMVYSLSGNHPKYPKYPTDLIPIHPHCKCTLVPVIEAFLTPSEQRTIDERLKQGTGSDPRTEAEKAMYERDQAINRRNNAEKKLYARMQTELGAEAPQSLGAFRRMKRQNTVQYQELYSNYLSATHSRN